METEGLEDNWRAAVFSPHWRQKMLQFDVLGEWHQQWDAEHMDTFTQKEMKSWRTHSFFLVLLYIWANQQKVLAVLTEDLSGKSLSDMHRSVSQQIRAFQVFFCFSTLRSTSVQILNMMRAGLEKQCTEQHSQGSGFDPMCKGDKKKKIDEVKNIIFGRIRVLSNSIFFQSNSTV